MSNDPPDFEKYADTLRKTMDKAIAEAEALSELAGADREATAELRAAIREKENELDHLARQAATDYVAAHQQELKDKIRQNIMTLVASKLLNSGQSVAAIAGLLDVPEDFVTRLS